MKSFSLRTKLILSFSIVIIVGVFLSSLVGIRLIGDTIIRQVQDKVRLDLNSAREVYREESETVKNIVRLSTTRYYLIEAILKNNREQYEEELRKIRESEPLDILSLTDVHGVVLARASNLTMFGDKVDDPIVNYVLNKKEVIVSTEIVPKQDLEKEGKQLAEQALIKLIPTPMARPVSAQEESSGMIIKAAAPIYGRKGELIGVLYGGKLLNRNYKIVDKVKDIVYRGEKYKGTDIGTVTIFQQDLRISTNVKTANGERAIGTRVSKEVYDQVIGKGIPWIAKAFVVNTWYITAYEPIRNLSGNIIGMLYVGILEQPYIDLRQRVVYTFYGIAVLSVILLSIIAYFTTINITRPVHELAYATNKVAEGDLTYRVQIKSHDEIGQLADSFNRMTVELQKATAEYFTLMRTLEEKVKDKTDELAKTQDQLIQTEKLSSLGKLAAGIAHEINNPLTSILLNSCVISEKLADGSPLKENLKLIIDETARCGSIVKGLLEFSRQTAPVKEPTNINEVIEKTLLLFESQLLVNHVRVARNLDKSLPRIMIDSNKIKQVFTNIILNAIEAMQKGGVLTIGSMLSEEKNYVLLQFTDTGSGISKEHMSKIFDPFFTTKSIKGTGLGLSITYGIVQQHEGTIDVRSEPGKGTTMIVSLPVGQSKKN